MGTKKIWRNNEFGFKKYWSKNVGIENCSFKNENVLGEKMVKKLGSKTFFRNYLS